MTALENLSAPAWWLLTLYREHAPRRLDLSAQPVGPTLELTRGQNSSAAALPEPGSELLSARSTLDDPHVSTCHARLMAGPRGVEIQDLGSKNGVWVDGRRVDRAWLRAGTLVRIGRTLLRLVRAQDLPRCTLERRFDLVWGSALAPVGAAIDERRVADQPWLLWGEGGSGKRSAARALSRGLAAPKFADFDALRIPQQLREVELLGNQRVHGAVAGSARGLLYISRPELLPARLLPAMFEQAAAAHTTLAFGLTSADSAELVRCALAHAAVELRSPPLRERVLEIPALIQSVIPRGVMGVGVEFVEACCLGSWPGNVSQLVRATRDALARAVAERAATLGQRHLSAEGCPA